MKKTTFLLCIVCFMSCKKTLMIVMGVKQPKIENNESIMKFLVRADVQSADVYYVDSSASYNFWADSSMVDRLIDLRIYNGKGEMLKKLERGQCTAIYTDGI